jgi:hypothetical protein
MIRLQLYCYVMWVPYQLSVINGRIVVRDGKLLTVDIEKLIERHNAIAVEMAAKYPVPERFKLV